MTQGRLVIDVVNAGVNVAFAVALLFPFAIRMVWDWTASDWGWNLILKDFAIALAILGAWLHIVLGINPNTYFFMWASAVSIWAIPIIIIWRGRIIWRTQRHPEAQRDFVSRHQRVPEPNAEQGGPTSYQGADAGDHLEGRLRSVPPRPSLHAVA
jgi:hypothetical protein